MRSDKAARNYHLDIWLDAIQWLSILHAWCSDPPGLAQSADTEAVGETPRNPWDARGNRPFPARERPVRWLVLSGQDQVQTVLQVNLKGRPSNTHWPLIVDVPGA